MITEPIQIITKTSANSGPPSPICIESGDACRTLKLIYKYVKTWMCFIVFDQETYMAMNVQSIKGPHKSPKIIYKIHCILINIKIS